MGTLPTFLQGISTPGVAVFVCWAPLTVAGLEKTSYAKYLYPRFKAWANVLTECAIANTLADNDIVHQVVRIC